MADKSCPNCGKAVKGKITIKKWKPRTEGAEGFKYKVDANWQSQCILGLYQRNRSSFDYVLKKTGDSVQIYPFENGRERGYSVRHGDKVFSFAENRNSDNIVVYPYDEAGMNDDDYYNRSKYFKSQQFLQAFNYINDQLGIEL